jgi:hypothetical protein
VQKLSLAGCQNFTNAGLLALAPLQALQTLDLSRCPEITLRGLRALKRSRKRSRKREREKAEKKIEREKERKRERRVLLLR